MADDDLSIPVLLLKDHDLHSNFCLCIQYWQIIFGMLARNSLQALKFGRTKFCKTLKIPVFGGSRVVLIQRM